MSKTLNRWKRYFNRCRAIVATPWSNHEPCGNCGMKGGFLPGRIFWPALIEQWALTPQQVVWMDQREGSRCAWCKCSLRSSQLAHALVAVINRKSGDNAACLKQAFRSEKAHALRVAEINQAGSLHNTLRRCRGLRYSDYGSTNPAVPSEDLTRLSYADASLDLVVTSDTLEHVPDVDTALREIYRVLAPGGAHVFTVPIMEGRTTLRRAELRDGKVIHLLPPSYHGGPATVGGDLLVFNEFGDDFVARCAGAGFLMATVKDPNNPTLVTLIATKA
jgi:Methyltransferase domain